MHDEQTTAIFHRLRALKADCGPNKHDQAISLIWACISEGWDSGPRIVGALKALDLNPRHVGKTLRDLEGPNPENHWWHRDQDGRYSVHPRVKG
jgi:hypothetical protein